MCLKPEDISKELIMIKVKVETEKYKYYHNERF